MSSSLTFIEEFESTFMILTYRYCFCNQFYRFLIYVPENELRSDIQTLFAYGYCCFFLAKGSGMRHRCAPSKFIIDRSYWDKALPTYRPSYELSKSMQALSVRKTCSCSELFLSECEKMWPRITPNTDTFYAVWS